jgi:hypothetical protein
MPGAKLFKLRREKPPKDGGGDGELERVIQAGGAGISEPIILRTASGLEIVIPPVSDPRKELIVEGTGGSQTFQKGVQYMGKELTRKYGDNDTGDYKAWER